MVTVAELLIIVEQLRKERDKLKEECKRLNKASGGDIESQAKAWNDVYATCVKIGLLSHFESSLTGRGRVVSFIESLYYDSITWKKKYEDLLEDI